MGLDQQRLAIVTVTFNSAAVLPEFLQSLKRQTHAAFTLYAVDNASADSSVEILEAESDPRIVVIRNDRNTGFAEGSNQGIMRALDEGCSLIMLLNNDTEFGTNFLETLLTTAATRRHALFAPKMCFYDDPQRIWYAGGRFAAWLGNSPEHIGEGKMDEPRFSLERDIEFITGCCMLVRANVFRTIGLLDERYFAYLEDADFCLRARHAGFRLRYVPSAQLNHKVSSLTGGTFSPFSIRMGVRNRVYFLRKHNGYGAFLIFSTLYLSYLAAKLLIGLDTPSRFRLRLRAFREGFALKPNKPVITDPGRAGNLIT